MQASDAARIIDLDRETPEAGAGRWLDRPRGRARAARIRRRPYPRRSVRCRCRPSIPSQLPDGERVVFSCASGVRSGARASSRAAAGTRHREHYKGGFKDWVGAGEPVE